MTISHILITDSLGATFSLEVNFNLNSPTPIITYPYKRVLKVTFGVVDKSRLMKFLKPPIILGIKDKSKYFNEFDKFSAAIVDSSSVSHTISSGGSG